MRPFTAVRNYLNARRVIWCAIATGRAKRDPSASLRIAPIFVHTKHHFLRPGELHGAERCEVDLATRDWLIPAARMKMNQDHLVPLPR